MGKVKCLTCGKEVDSEKAVFKNGKFFDSEACLKKAQEKSKEGCKGNVCEFC